MNHEQLIAEAKEASMSPWEKHRFLVLVGATIVISFILVAISLFLYNSSGAAQLDLSRPGYVSVREKVDTTNKFKSFPSTGPIDDEAIRLFRQLYEDQVEKAIAIDSFGGKVMTDESLSIGDPDSSATDEAAE